MNRINSPVLQTSILNKGKQLPEEERNYRMKHTLNEANVYMQVPRKLVEHLTDGEITPTDIQEAQDFADNYKLDPLKKNLSDTSFYLLNALGLDFAFDELYKDEAMAEAASKNVVYMAKTMAEAE